jgi:YesN/AraC family two-component response regulator
MIVPKNHTFKTHCVHFDWTIPKAADDFWVENTYLQMFKGPGNIYLPAEAERFSRPNPEFDLLQNTPLITGLSYDFIAPIFRTLYQNYQNKHNCSNLMQKALFLQIIAHICERTQEPKTSSSLKHHKIVFEATLYMQAYFSDDLNLPLLAEHVGLSPKYFGQLFIAQTGVDVHTYLTNIRISHVKYLLTHTNHKLEYIAATCGFNDKFYLSKVFKQRTGMTVSEYRKLYQ